jgi:hypothetical protein
MTGLSYKTQVSIGPALKKPKNFLIQSGVEMRTGYP